MQHEVIGADKAWEFPPGGSVGHAGLEPWLIKGCPLDVDPPHRAGVIDTHCQHEFAGGALVIGSLLALTLGFHFFSRASKVTLFWIAFVLTRPFGATLGDVLTKKPAEGGLNLGTLPASGVLLAVLIVAILYSDYRDKKAAA